MKRVDQILFNLDGTKLCEIIGKNKSDVLNKSRDGLLLKRDTRSNWPGYWLVVLHVQISFCSFLN